MSRFNAAASGGGGFELRFDPQQLRDLQETLAGVRDGVPRAANAAINRTLVTGRTRIVRRLGREVTLGTRTIVKYFGIRKSTFATLQGAIQISRKPIPLMAFKPTWSRAKGVTVRVRRDRPADRFPESFVATMGSGHTGVFRRKHLGTGKRVGRLPIQERFGPTPLGVFANAPGVAQQELAQLATVLDKNLASQVDRLLNRRRVT